MVEEIKQAGRQAAALQLNIGDVRSFGSFFEQVAEILKESLNTERFDYLINNAGIGINVPYIDTTEEQFDQLMNVNLRAFISLHKRHYTTSMMAEALSIFQAD